jgi:hypothetical protein
VAAWDEAASEDLTRDLAKHTGMPGSIRAPGIGLVDQWRGGQGHGPADGPTPEVGWAGMVRGSRRGDGDANHGQ